MIYHKNAIARSGASGQKGEKMKRRELAEIKKLFTPANCPITRIAIWLVNDERECINDLNVPFFNIPEEMMFKFFDIFKKVLSGKIGKNLYNLEFNNYRDELLVKVKEDKLGEEGIYQHLMERIVDGYEHEGRYAIVMIHGIYDIPGKASDNSEMFDASEEVYDFIMTCICPVALQRPGIRMDEDRVENAERQWIMMPPENAFVYPAFNERTEDRDHVWLYTKKEPDTYLVEEALECKYPETPEIQKKEFEKLVSEMNIESMKRIYQDILRLSAESEEPITKNQIEKIVGVEMSEEDKKIIVQNLMNMKHFDIDMAEASITVAADFTDLVREQEIDGETYILVKKSGDVSVNGIALRG